jgi:hypothetical protein
MLPASQSGTKTMYANKRPPAYLQTPNNIIVPFTVESLNVPIMVKLPTCHLLCQKIFWTMSRGLPPWPPYAINLRRVLLLLDQWQNLVFQNPRCSLVSPKAPPMWVLPILAAHCQHNSFPTSISFVDQSTKKLSNFQLNPELSLQNTGSLTR